MDFKKVVNWVEAAALAAAAIFVIMLFANQGGGGATSKGAQLFAANCASCHGADGSGGLGPRLAGRVTKDFPGIDKQIAFVKAGKGAMPSFEGDLSDEEIRLVVEYTRTLGK
jgi:mono/diheme cytochrome c family protein